MQQNIQPQVIKCPSCENASIGLDPAKILSGTGLSCKQCGWVMASGVPSGFGQMSGFCSPAAQSLSVFAKQRKAG